MLDLEGQLRQEFQVIAQGVHVDESHRLPALQPEAHSRRRHWVWSVVAGMALSVLVVVGVVLGRQALTDSPPPLSPPPLPDSESWVRSLPLGSEPTLAYTDGTALVTREGTFSLPGDDAGLVGEAEMGYVVLVEHPRPGVFSEYGLVTRSGRYESLPVGTGAVYDAAISPDGRLAAYQGSVLDLDRRSVVANLPGQAVSVMGWGPQGILLSAGTASGRLLFDPATSRSIRLDAEVFTLATKSQVAIVAGRCSQAVELAADGTMNPLYSGCGPESVDAVSPDGDVLVLQDLTLLDASTSQPLSLGIPPIRYAAGRASWEDDTTLLLLSPVDDTGPYSTPQQVIRCDLVAATCERAGDPITLQRGESLDFAPGIN